MNLRPFGFGVVAAVALATSGSSAWTATCATAPVATYTTAGFTCTVDGLTFSDFAVNVTTAGGGSVILGSFTPFTGIIAGVLESGLSLTYTALAPVAGASADIAWTYVVTGSVPIIDAFLALAGNTSGSGVASVSEILSNGVVLSLNAPGSTTAVFAPISTLGVFKDQIDFVGPTGGFSTTSILTNAFSTVPGPVVGAGLPGLVLACGGLIALARRRRRRVAA